MSTTILNRTNSEVIGASLLVPAPARYLYEAVLDVRSFPSWAPGVQRVEITKGPVGPGMVSEWEVSVLGIRCRISSLLVQADDLTFLRWTYEGFISGWGECTIEDWGNSALAEFRTQLRPTDPYLEKLMRTLPFRHAARSHLKRCLVQLGQAVSGNTDGVRVGPLEISSRPSAVSR